MRQPDLPNTMELVGEMHRLSHELDKALRFVHRQAQRWAEAENAYRMARAKLQLEAADCLRKQGIDKPTVDEKKAYVDLHTSKERVDAHLAESLLRAGHEAVRSRRAQISAVQSVANAVRTEVEMARVAA